MGFCFLSVSGTVFGNLFTKLLGMDFVHQAAEVGFVHQAPGVDFLHQTGVFGLCSPPQGEDFLHQTGVVWTLFTTPGGGLPSPNWGHLDFVHHPRRRTSFTKLGSFGLCLPKHSAWTYFTKVGLFVVVNEVMFCLVVVRRTHVGQRGAHME